MNFRANGQSTGQVTVEFQRAEDAAKAYANYNNRVIDGKKTLRVEEVVDPARAAALRTAQAAAAAAPAAAAATATQTRAAGAGRRGRGRPGRGGRGAGSRREARPKKTVEDLDAEMEDYSSNKAAPATS